MNFEDDIEERESRIAPGSPLPPGDWQGFSSGARLEAIYAAHGPQLQRYVRRRAHAQDVGDIVQECFRRLTQSRSLTAGLIDRPAAYLARTARNLMAEQARTSARHSQAEHQPYEEDAHAGSDPHDALEARDTIRRLEEVIARLKPKTRTIFLLHRIEGLSYEEIAAAQGMSVKGVEKQMAKALGAIRRSHPGGR